MGKKELKNLVKMAPAFINHKELWSSYDEKGDILYINFEKPQEADDSELTDDDILIRYKKGKVIGITILNAKTR